MAYLAIDIGSSAVKAGLVSERGSLLGLARRGTPLRHGADGAHESMPGEWVDAASSACRQLAADYPGVEIRALAISGNGPTLLAADAAGRPLGPALSWMDRRAKAEAEEVSALAGSAVDASFYLPKALRLWRGSAELRARARWFFSCPEYLVFVLSGEALTYLPHPGYTPYFWDAGLTAALGLPGELFPPFASPGCRCGAVTAAAAERFGLPEGLPVVTSFPDFLAAILGSACVEPGMVCDRGGTSEAVNICARRPFPGRELLSLPHAVSGLWNISGGLSTAGKALEWLSEALGMGGDEVSPSFFEEARSSVPGAGGAIFLPYLAGERAPLWDAERRGAFLGLSLSTGKGELARAACESIAYGLELALERARAGGFSTTLARTSGASARDDFMNGLKADVWNLPVEAPEITDCEIAGDACACAYALGDASSLAEASSALVRVARRFEPHTELARIYGDSYAAFAAAVAALGGTDALLAAARSGASGGGWRPLD